MKINKTILLLLLPLMLALTSFKNSDSITGKWVFSDSPREIEIYRENNKYYGKIIKVSGTEKKEKVGHILLLDFVYNPAEKEYTGKINSPSGMKASGELEVLDENKLKLNIKKLFISKSFTLTRIQ
jgi:uncharacterized protein (DUF2147 family)